MRTRITTRQVGDRHKVIINGKESNFHLDELVHPLFYNTFGVHALRFLQPEAIEAVQLFRTAAGSPVFLNNWYHGGPYKGSGLRTWNFTPSAKYSIHKWGGAYDVKIEGLSSHEMLKITLSIWPELYKVGLRRVEDPEFTESKHGELGQDWHHMDTGWSLLSSIESPDIIEP